MRRAGQAPLRSQLVRKSGGLRLAAVKPAARCCRAALSHARRPAPEGNRTLPPGQLQVRPRSDASAAAGTGRRPGRPCPPGMASAGKDAAWKGRVEQIEELAQTDPVLGQRLRAARSLELLKAHDSRERDSESDFAAAMMRREKEDLLRINARVRQVNQWCKQLGEDRRYTLVKYPSDLTTPYGRLMAKHDASVAQKAALLKPHLALPAAPSSPRQRPSREDVYHSATAAMRSPERQRAGSAAPPGRSAARPTSASSAGGAKAAAPPVGETARPASATLARATVPPVTTSRVVIRLAQASGEPRQLSVALFEREVAKLSRRVAEARAAGTLGQGAGAGGSSAEPSSQGAAAARSKRGADRLLISEASALVDARASPMAATAAAAARARQSKAQVQAELRRALRETAFLTQALRTQAKVLRDKGWNAGGRAGAVPRAPEGAAELARTIARSGTAPWED
mmetsp:Transcript_829/g.3213  ORF Transcript_829/g.3213 Transcript_829/m.3213 type:complete len:457 (+) Transcript_829:319-1689(+)